MLFAFLYLAFSALLRLPVVRFTNWPFTYPWARPMLAGLTEQERLRLVAGFGGLSWPSPEDAERRQSAEARKAEDGRPVGRRMKAPSARCSLFGRRLKNVATAKSSDNAEGTSRCLRRCSPRTLQHKQLPGTAEVMLRSSRATGGCGPRERERLCQVTLSGAVKETVPCWSRLS